MKKLTISLIGALLLAMLPAISSGNPIRIHFSFQDTVAVETAEEMEEAADTEEYPAEKQEKVQTKRGDTTFISVAKKDIQIIEKDGETEVKIKKQGEEKYSDVEEYEDMDEDDEITIENEHKGSEFKGHWAGFEFGLNNFVDKDMSLSRSPESAFMELNTGKSWNFNLNFSQYSLGFGTDRVGLVTGLGLEWSNYHFSDTNSIQKANGQIEARPLSQNTKKNRLQTTYLTIPLILEAQFLEDKEGERAYLGVGVIGGVKLFSNTKIKYANSSNNEKEKIKDDFYLSPIRYALTARLGYRAIKLYVNYYPTPLFMADKGPEELYPVAAGFVVSF